MAIIELVDKINTVVEKKNKNKNKKKTNKQTNETTIGILLDLSKTFKLLITLLLYKLEHYGFCGIKQYVSYNFHESQLEDTVCGVPQGSNLGSLLLIWYVNDITYTSNVIDFILFADDTTIITRMRTKRAK